MGILQKLQDILLKNLGLPKEMLETGPSPIPYHPYPYFETIRNVAPSYIFRYWLTSLLPYQLAQGDIRIPNKFERTGLYQDFFGSLVPYINGRIVSYSEYSLFVLIGYIKKNLSLAFVLTGTPFYDLRVPKKQLPATIHVYGFFRIGYMSFVALPQFVEFKTTFGLHKHYSELDNDDPTDGDPLFNYFMLKIAQIALYRKYQQGIKGVPFIDAAFVNYTKEPPKPEHHIVIIPHNNFN